jgi:hypothetical protein
MTVYLSSSILGVDANKKPQSDGDLLVKADGDIDDLSPIFDIPTEQALPTEIIRFIPDIAVANEQSGALVNAAQCNRGVYDYVVPRLYKIIRVTKENRERLFFGCTRKLSSSFTYVYRLMIQPPTDRLQDSLAKILP